MGSDSELPRLRKAWREEQEYQRRLAAARRSGAYPVDVAAEFMARGLRAYMRAVGNGLRQFQARQR